MATDYRINLSKVEKSLLFVQKNFDRINDTLDMRRESMGDDIVSNMLAGYRYVNRLLEKDINLLGKSGLHHLLELNHIVLCGEDPEVRADFKAHISATTDRFYGQEEFSIRDIRLWAKRHREDSPWKRAAGVYILHISQPQLFFEGNHRTGALLMSHTLVRSGQPPFVITVENAKAYFDPSSLAKSTRKNILGRYYLLPKLKKKFAKFIKTQSDPELLK